jgi:hypothetical protein
VFLGGRAHDLKTAADYFSGLIITELIVKLRTAHDVREQNDNFDIPTHG